jgi:hypothetical protein
MGSTRLLRLSHAACWAKASGVTASGEFQSGSTEW